MISSSAHTPASAIHQNRQQLLQERRHKRQQSTPNANFDTIRIAPPHPQQSMAAPNSASLHAHRQSMGHRRGLSLDTRRQVLSNRQVAAAAAAAAAATTTTGPLSVGMVHPTSSPVASSIQEHRMMVGRPFIMSMEQDNYLISPHTTPHSQRFDTGAYDTTPIQFDSSFGPHMGLQSAPIVGKEFNFFTSDSPLGTPSFVYAESPTAAGNWLPEGNAQPQSQPQAQSQLETQAQTQGGFQRHTRRISNGILDRVTKFETMGMEGPQSQDPTQGQTQDQGPSGDATRPTTPTNQNVASHTQTSYMPPTPMETPQDRQDQEGQQVVQQQSVPAELPGQQHQDNQALQSHHQHDVFRHPPPQPTPARFEDGYDESMEETVKPIRKQAARPLTSFDEMRQQAEQPSLSHSHSRSQSQSHPQPQAQHRGHGHSHSIHSVHSVSHPTMPNTPVKQMSYGDPANMSQPPSAGYLNMNNVNTEFIKLQDQYAGIVSADVTQYHHAMMAGMMPAGPMPGMIYPAKSEMNPLHGLSLPDSPLDSRRGSPHRRNDSMASMASAASIASINIEETKTETGVTLEDIAQYIQGPEADNKYSCLFEGCGKRFGRKENIKSHVQTHLNDRQYQCPTCQKCFVRQHDLKRHAKIHTGIKPYPCECGNSFARHDALTRHRQRGMCIGAFDGIVRKVVKRGRPRKKRPDLDTRTEKSARTRRKNNLSISSTSSFSSESSGPESPHNDYDMDDDQGFDLLDVALPPDCVIPGVAVPMPVSTGPTTGVANPAMIAMAHSMSLPEDYSGTHTVVASPHSYVSPDTILDGVVARSSPHIKSEYNTPPELSKSKSPTPCSRMFESDGAAPTGTHIPPPSSSTAASSATIPTCLPALSDAPSLHPTLLDESLMTSLHANESGGGAPTPSASTSAASVSGSTTSLSQSTTLSEDDLLIGGFGGDGLVLDRDASVLMMQKFDEEFEAVSMFPATDDMFFSAT
ncbi:hypothetical protein BROUX41_006569 [Berkeleyomyces rouxiae]|uniref:uncharacterized protein n=1 Tax=Berkeleyomyces rouxiae TaxID=2035830 RepID=UPI003B76FCEC